MANEYDRIIKENFRESKATLLHRLVGDTLASIKPLVPKLQRTLEQEPDTVVEVQTVAGKRFIVHIEWQSSNDAKMVERMALYDLLLAQKYQQEVLGAVLYLGNEPLRMKDTYSFFKFRYQCEMIDVRQLDPEAFLQSEDAGEVIFAVLAGSSDPVQKEITVHRIFAKLQLLFANDIASLQVKIRQLEVLSLLRGKTIQQIILQEESKMPITIDITQDLRYLQGLEIGIEKGIEVGIEKGRDEGVQRGKAENQNEIAERLLQEGLTISFIQKITGLPVYIIEMIAQKLSNNGLL